MAEQLGDRGVAFAMRRELRPVRRNLVAVVEQAALYAHRHRDRDDALGGAEHQLQRRVVVRPVAGGVESAAPDVDDPLAAVVHGGGCADFLTQFEALLERRLHRLPAGCDEAVRINVRHAVDGSGI